MKQEVAMIYLHHHRHLHLHFYLNFQFPPPPPTFPSTDQLFGSHVMKKEKKEEEKEKVLDEIDDKIYELPDLPKPELGYQLLNTLDAESRLFWRVALSLQKS